MKCAGFWMTTLAAVAALAAPVAAEEIWTPNPLITIYEGPDYSGKDRAGMPGGWSKGDGLQETSADFADTNWQESSQKLYALAGEVTKALGGKQ
jgi:hypothetical protein